MGFTASDMAGVGRDGGRVEGGGDEEEGEGRDDESDGAVRAGCAHGSVPLKARTRAARPGTRTVRGRRGGTTSRTPPRRSPPSLPCRPRRTSKTVRVSYQRICHSLARPPRPALRTRAHPSSHRPRLAALSSPPRPLLRYAHHARRAPNSTCSRSKATLRQPRRFGRRRRRGRRLGRRGLAQQGPPSVDPDVETRTRRGPLRQSGAGG